ncbi:hypothetical protein QOT17_017901 [Balamuthia mandrillaris]
MGTKLTKEQKKLVHQTPFNSKEIKAIHSLFQQVVKERTPQQQARRSPDELTKEEFRQVFETMAGTNLPGEDEDHGIDLNQIFDSIDSDGNGAVSFNEMILWLAIYSKGSTEQKLEHMFRAFDVDDSGELEASEINNVLETLKISMTDRGLDERSSIKRAADLVKRLDKDKDGRISMEEWVRIGKEVGLVDELVGPQFLELMGGLKAGKGK